MEGEDIDGKRQLFQNAIVIIHRNTRTLEQYALCQERVNESKRACRERLLLGLETDAVEDPCNKRG